MSVAPASGQAPWRLTPGLPPSAPAGLNPPNPERWHQHQLRVPLAEGSYAYRAQTKSFERRDAKARFNSQQSAEPVQSDDRISAANSAHSEGSQRIEWDCIDG